MRHLTFIAGMIVLLSGCVKKPPEVYIWIENSSDVTKELPIATYLNGKLVDERVITGDSIIGMKYSFKLPLVQQVDQYTLDFKAMGGNETVSYKFSTDTLNKGSIVHVNYVEVLFKKGYQYYSETLTKDTIVEKKFYAELLNGR
jgi:hypothetical protein